MHDTNKAISLKDAAELWRQGAQCLVVEYRNTVAEVIQWRDRETQKMMTAPVLRHNVETQSGPLIVQERTGEGFDAAAYKSPFTKGQRYLLWFSELATQRGVTTGRGMLQLLTPGS
jgi:hypothetical protein